MRTADRLEGMSPSEVLLFFISSTRPYLRALESAELMDLLAVFRAYILHGYEEDGLQVPPRLAPAWERCKARLNRYTGQEARKA